MNIGHDDDRGAPLDAGPPRGLERRWFRRVVSVWLVFHLAAIIIAPAAVGPGVRAGARESAGLFQPYLGLLYLDHGYHFFAPEPAESTLLAYEAERADGTVVRGRIPDRDDPAPAALPPLFHAHRAHERRARRDSRELWHESYAEHIGREYGATPGHA